MRKPLLLAALLCALLSTSVIGCATLGKVVRTVDVFVDVAQDLCEIWGAQQGEAALGEPVGLFCAKAENYGPFIEPAKEAMRVGGGLASARLSSTNLEQ